ncbi:hypothetical protein ACH5RR_001088 [Cinchona calisaya]|uniref:Uncharacterized protein n=1 Tax=Cinchona calisaya TaxID=153742 RepID=A0ABD3B2F4_9GENT
MASKDVSSKVAGKSSSTARSDDASLYASDADSSTRFLSKSHVKEQKKLDSALLEASYISSLYMQAMMTGASSVEEQLASMGRAVEKLSKTIEENDLQITALVSKLKFQNIGETSQVNNNKSDKNPQMDDSAKIFFRSSSRRLVDDSMNLLATGAISMH